MVLSIYRMWYTLNHGNIVSKPQAAEWAKKELSKDWFSLINAALLWKEKEEFDRLNQTVDFINYTVNYSKQY